MRKLLAAMRKEFLLLIRDKVGLAILFIMPMVLIFVMTLIQDAAFKTLNEEGIPLLILNEDQDTLGQRIVDGLKSTDLISCHDRLEGKELNRDELYKAVQQGNYLIGIIIPKGATDALRDNVENLVNESLGEAAGNETASVEIEIVIDPIASKSFVVSVTSQLREFISSVKTRTMFQVFNTKIAALMPEGTEVKTE